MAGLGRKVFTAGEILTAANFQGYAVDQSVQVYSGTAARSTALGTAVSEGMVSYLTASDSTDLANQIDFYNGSAWESVYAPGRNYIINGGFDFWQRGTSQSNDGYYSADRFSISCGGALWRKLSNIGAITGAANGLEIASTATNWVIQHAIELTNQGDASEFQQGFYTLSFWAYIPNNLTISTEMYYSDDVSGNNQTAPFLSASFTGIGAWKKYSVTATPSSRTPNASNKAIRLVIFNLSSVAFANFAISALQFEKGSIATPFRRAGGTYQGELAACQRYYMRLNASSSPTYIGNGWSYTATAAIMLVPLNTTMRTIPDGYDFSGTMKVQQTSNFEYTVSAIVVNGAQSTNTNICLALTHASGASNTSGMLELFPGSYLALKAEL